MVESKKDNRNDDKGPLCVTGLLDIDVIDNADLNHLIIALGEGGGPPSTNFAEMVERTSVLLASFSRNQVREALTGVKDRLPEGVLEQIESQLDLSDSLPEDSNNPLRKLKGEEARRALLHTMANLEQRTDKKKLEFLPLVFGKDLKIDFSGNIMTASEYDDD